MPKKTKQEPQSDSKMDSLMLHYNRVRQDMDTRRTRKNGWNEIVSAYMGRLPANWPFISVVTDPVIRTTILEKTSRLLNAKLHGRLVPRNEGDMIRAKIMNALLDFNWDAANHGGSMLEKVALADQTTRLFGAAFALVYWNTKLDINEIKIIDQRDIGFDGAALHIRDARWVQIREFTTWDKLEERGYDVKKLKSQIEKGEITSQFRSSSYEDIVKANRGLQDRVGEIDDPKNPIIEIVTEWTPNTCTIFLPRYGMIVEETKNPYKHGKIPVAQLRYYPLGSDIYGESEVESVIPLQRALNAILCGFIDEMVLNMRPPLKVSASGVRIETIQYGPGAMWLMQNPSQVTEMQFSPQVISAFNSTYPALKAAYNTAMGDQSLGISNIKGSFTDKTATEVRALSNQQNNRDQYNQMYLGEFLKDIMMMWLSNIQQYLLDDPTKAYHVLRVIGKDQIQQFQQLKLDAKNLPDFAVQELTQTIQMSNGQVDPALLAQTVRDLMIPEFPVIENPKEKDPAKYKLKNKLSVNDNGIEADLYVTREDLSGEYDYIPDVTSMATGTLQSLKDARKQALESALNPLVPQLLAGEGYRLKMKDLLEDSFEDAGIDDAEGLFEPLQQQQQLPVPNQLNGQPIPPGPISPQAGPVPNGAGPVGGIPQVPQAPNNGAFGQGLPPAGF